MNAKLFAGSVLAGLSLIGAILDAWARHFFFTMFHIARAESLEGAGSFSPGPYGVDPHSTQIFIGIRVLLWLCILLGVALLVWGVWEETQPTA